MTQREMTHLCVLYDSFTCDRQSLRYEHNDPFTYDSFICDKHVCMISALWLLCVYTMTNLCALWLVEVPWLFDMCTKSHLRAMPYNLCAMTHAYGSTIISCCVRCDWLICAPWRVVCVHHDSFTCAQWLGRMCAMTQLHVHYDWCGCDRQDCHGWCAPWFMYMRARTDVRAMIFGMRHEFLVCVSWCCIYDMCTVMLTCTPWLVYMRTWLLDMCVTTHANMTHSYMSALMHWFRTFTYITTHSHLWLYHICDMIHLHMYYDSFVCAPWFIHICAMTHLYGHRDFVCAPWEVTFPWEATWTTIIFPHQ